MPKCVDYLEEEKVLDRTSATVTQEVGEQVLLSFSNALNPYRTQNVSPFLV